MIDRSPSGPEHRCSCAARMMMKMKMSGPPARAGLLLCALVFLPPCARSHPQPCQVLKRIGHTVRVGVLHVHPRLLPGSEGWEAEPGLLGSGPPRVQTSVGASGHGSLRTRGSVNSPRGSSRNRNQSRKREENAARQSRVFAPRDSVLAAVEAVNRGGLLPFNLSLEVVMAVGSGLGELPAFSSSDDEDPLSFVESVCHTVVVQGVSAMVAFPRNRDEFVKLEFVSQALHVPVVSVVRREFTRHSQVRQQGESVGDQNHVTS